MRSAFETHCAHGPSGPVQSAFEPGPLHKAAARSHMRRKLFSVNPALEKVVVDQERCQQIRIRAYALQRKFNHQISAHTHVQDSLRCAGSSRDNCNLIGAARIVYENLTRPSLLSCHPHHAHHFVSLRTAVSSTVSEG